jgi:hypothetical protein
MAKKLEKNYNVRHSNKEAVGNAQRHDDQNG